MLNFSKNLSTPSGLVSTADCYNWASDQVKGYVFQQKTDYLVYGVILGFMSLAFFYILFKIVLFLTKKVKNHD